jgi:hypothetical protein
MHFVFEIGVSLNNKGHGAFAAMASETEKPWAASFDLPTAVLVYFTLTSPFQRRADRCKIGIKPITIKIDICVQFFVHRENS